jgi:hypothetical protein
VAGGGPESETLHVPLTDRTSVTIGLLEESAGMVNQYKNEDVESDQERKIGNFDGEKSKNL